MKMVKRSKVTRAVKKSARTNKSANLSGSEKQSDVKSPAATSTICCCVECEGIIQDGTLDSTLCIKYAKFRKCVACLVIKHSTNNDLIKSGKEILCLKCESSKHGVYEGGSERDGKIPQHLGHLQQLI